MMDEQRLREQIHCAVDAYTPIAEAPPYLTQRILARANGKESVKVKKKLSTAAILVIALLLISATALAIGMSVEDMWKQSFDRMNTTGEIRNLSDETQAEISMEEAIAIARSAITGKFGTPEAELDAMGVYPTYAARGWDGKTDDYPSDWEVFFSSRTDVELDLDHTDYGPTGEYLVRINAETKEIDTCIWYTNDFWSRAQAVWDCGSYDEVYWQYKQTDFYGQSIEQQTYWRDMLKKHGYEVVPEDEKLHALLLRASTPLQFTPVEQIADNSLPQVAAAWAALENAYGLEAGLMQKYAYVATVPSWKTGTEDVCIHYDFELEFAWLEEGLIDDHCDQMFSYVKKLGLFMVSFEPGTTEVKAITHVKNSEDAWPWLVTEGELLARSDWTAEDLLAFDEAYTELEKAIARMHRAGADVGEMGLVRDAVMRALGGDPELYDNILEGYDIRRWFSDETAPTSTPEPPVTKEEAQALYGKSPLYWPVEVRYALSFYSNRNLTVPQEGELTQEEATKLAIALLTSHKGQEALDELGDYRVGCTLTRFEGDYGKEVTQWKFYICNAERDEENGWYVRFIDKNREDYCDDWAEVRPFAEVGVG